MFERNKIICIDLDSPDYISNISITKNDVRFSIKKLLMENLFGFYMLNYQSEKNTNC